MKLTRRRAITAGLLVLAAGFIAWSAPRNATEAPQAARAGDLRAQSQRVAPVPDTAPSIRTPIDPLDRDPFSESTTDPFKAVNFLPEPPPVVVAAPVPPPAAPPFAPVPLKPPFPYRYFGQMSDVTGKQVTYLTRDNAIVPIQLGAILDNVYRIDLVAENRIVFTYLPLNETFEISVISAAN